MRGVFGEQGSNDGVLASPGSEDENLHDPNGSWLRGGMRWSQFWEDGQMARTRIADDAGEAAVRIAVGASEAAPAPRDTTAMAVRYLLQLLAERAEGNTVEVRVPPFRAVQCIPGPRH